MVQDFKRIETGISGLCIIKNKIYQDERGYFEETYNEEAFDQMGLPIHFVQDNHSVSHKGVIRGLHYQKSQPQGKLIRAISGEIFDVVLDLRKVSQTFGEWFGMILKANEGTQLWIPEGFAHGFQALSDATEIIYKCTTTYLPTDERGIFWNDPELAIQWKHIDKDAVVSNKDAALPLFRNAEINMTNMLGE